MLANTVFAFAIQPLQNVGDSNFACNAPGSTSSKVINVAAGGTVGSWWGHVLGGAQYSGDPDNPIASSHKGPIQAYLAKVDNAASASSYGQKWFKIASEGLSGGKWGVDTMIQNGGLWSAKIPECVAPGNYLLRIELLALHSASQQGQAQFYVCSFRGITMILTTTSRCRVLRLTLLAVARLHRAARSVSLEHTLPATRKFIPFNGLH